MRHVQGENRPPELVVIAPLNDWTCTACAGTGDLLVMDEPGPICLAYWMGSQLYGVKWRNFKLVLIAQMQEQDVPARLATPRLINLVNDPHEREPVALPHLHTWAAKRLNRLVGEYEASVKDESPIPLGAPLDHVPGSKR